MGITPSQLKGTAGMERFRVAIAIIRKDGVMTGSDFPNEAYRGCPSRVDFDLPIDSFIAKRQEDKGTGNHRNEMKSQHTQSTNELHVMSV